MKLAVIFPGVGYHTDKPLLYYSKKIAQNLGFEIVEVPYGGFEQNIKGSAEKMRAAFESALAQAEQILKDVSFDQYDKVLFISKSVGTAVASAYARKHHCAGYHVYYTPVEASFEAMYEEGIVFYGSADPWAAADKLEQGCRRKNLPYHVYEGANHSLETGDVKTDLQNLSDIMEKTESYIRSMESKRE